jgi:ABC-type Fe3+ transport system permease subunit
MALLESEETGRPIDESEELESVRVRDQIISGLKRVPGGIKNRIVGLGHGIASVIRGGANSFLSFARNPGDTIRGIYTKLREELDALSTIQLIAVIFAFGLFLVAPLLSVVAYSFFDPNTGLPSLFHFSNLFSDSNFWPWQWNSSNQQWDSYIDLRTVLFGGDLLVIQGIDLGAVLNSIYVAIITTAFSVIIGVFFAFIIARYDFPGKSIIRTVLIFPILATPFIGAIGIKRFLGPRGFFNNLFYTMLGITPFRVELQGLAAIIFVQSLSFFSLVYLNAYSSFMSIDPSLEEQAENLGATGFKLFRSVTLPLAMPGIQAGAILTFILSIEDLGTPIVYYEHQQAQKTLAYQVFASIATQSGQIDPAGPAIGILLLIFALTGFLAIRKYASLRSYASGSKGGQWNPRTRRLESQGLSVNAAVLTLGWIFVVFLLFEFGFTLVTVLLLAVVLLHSSLSLLPRYRTKLPPSLFKSRIKIPTSFLLYLVLIPVLFLALIPQISVIVLSFTENWATNSPLPTAWTLDNYSVLWEYTDVAQSINLTLLYGAIATVFIVLLGTSAAYLIARRDIPGKTWLDLLVTSPIALPGIVIATGYFTLFYNTPFFPAGFPAFLITMSYTIRKFPFTVRAAYAGLLSTPVALEEASQNLGASKNQTFAKITLPLIGVSVLAGSLLSFVYSVSEVSTSLILGSVGRSWAPMTFWTNEVLNATGQYGGYFNAACLGVLMMVLQMIVITITNKILGARSSAITGI